MQNVTENRIKDILKNTQGKKIAVVGDVMLDRYFWGSVSRISPEAPVPVIDVEAETFHLGGAANVANNLHSLGLEPLLCGTIGADNSGKAFKDIIEKSGISSDGLFVDKTRPTTVKTRIIGNNQQIARLDREIRDSVVDKGQQFIFNSIKNIENLCGIIFEDYNKGSLPQDLIHKIITYAHAKNIPVYVDPKFENFFSYRKVTVFKPNRKEARQALGFPMKTQDDIVFAGKKLLEMLECENVLLTLGPDGMMLFESGGEVSSVPTHARHISDVSGAGDTAIAALAAAMAGGANINEAASLANYAAGAVCEEPGIVSITGEMLLKTINNKRT